MKKNYHLVPKVSRDPQKLYFKDKLYLKIVVGSSFNPYELLHDLSEQF